MVGTMTTPRDHVETGLDTLALIDATVEKARAEFGDPAIDRQRVLELLKREGGWRSWALIPSPLTH